MDREMQNPATQFEACSEEGYDETTLELLALLGEEADEVTAEEVKRERAVEEERQARKRRQRAEKELSEQLQLLKKNKLDQSDMDLPARANRWWDTAEYRRAEWKELYDRVNDGMAWIDFSCYESLDYSKGMLHVTDTVFRFVLAVTRGRKYKVMRRARMVNTKSLTRNKS